MRKIRLVEGLPSAGEYNRLRKLVGWGTYHRAVIEESLPCSLYCVHATLGEELVGMARIVGDSGLVFYIQDVIVVPEHQGKGIGALLMDSVMAYVRAHASLNTTVGLMSARGEESFYQKYGFINRPSETLGSGMTIFWKGNDG